MTPLLVSSSRTTSLATVARRPSQLCSSPHLLISSLLSRAVARRDLAHRSKSRLLTHRHSRARQTVEVLICPISASSSDLLSTTLLPRTSRPRPPSNVSAILSTDLISLSPSLAAMDIEEQGNAILGNENLNPISTLTALDALVEDDEKKVRCG